MPDSVLNLPANHASDNRLARAISTQYCGMELQVSDHSQPCTVELNATELGNISLLRYKSEGLHHGTRSWSHVREDRSEYYFVQIPVAAQFDILHNGLATQLAPGQFVLLSSARPFQVHERAKRPNSFSTMVVRVPAPVLRQRNPNIDELCNQPFSISGGASHIMARWIETAIEDGASLSIQQAAVFGNAVADVIANTVASAEREGTRDCRIPRRSAREDTLFRARLFIEAHLADHRLNRDQIAAHCRVSVRHLQTVFKDAGATIAAYIRELRLQRCHEMLQNPAMRNCSLTRLADQWGFPDASHFSHAYRRRYGRPPRDDRQA